jgi:arsenate reductase (thioredoxin)
MVPEAIAVMKEVGIDITCHGSKHVDEFAGQDFDNVLTVCDNAKDNCAMFVDKAERLHYSFNGPAGVAGSEGKRLAPFR